VGNPKGVLKFQNPFRFQQSRSKQVAFIQELKSMQRSIATVSLSGTLPEKLEAI
ncbi:hypothetical protein PSYAR_31417, partial [Pseudomonas syringae pv. aceris str. M302273]